MAARCRLGILQSWPAALQSWLSILQSRSVSLQSSPRRSSVLALYFDQLRAPFTESTPPAAAKSHAPFTGSSRRRSPSHPSPDCSAAAAEVSRIFCGICPVEAVCSLQKQKSRHFCNFFAIRDSFLFLQSGNRLPNGRLPAFLHRNPRSGEPITIPNRKKVAIRADFLFSVPLPTALGWCWGRDDPSPALQDGPSAGQIWRCGINRRRFRHGTARRSDDGPDATQVRIRGMVCAIRVRRCRMVRRWSEAPRNDLMAAQARCCEMTRNDLTR